MRRSRARARRLLGAGLVLVVFGVPGAAAAGAAGRCGAYAWCDTGLAPAARAALMLGAMSQADKIGLLTAQPAPDVGLPRIDFVDGALGAGGLGNVGTPATALPAGIALAAGFDPGLAVRYGAVIGLEARHRGYDGVLGPTVGIMRTPLGGRTFEGYGEDPYLASQTAVGWVDGLQAEGVMADVKHFAANDQEGSPTPGGLLGDRMLTNVIADPRTLAEIDLPPFEAAVRVGNAASVMCSYNLVGGAYACENPDLLTQTLRDRWGFQGFVLADYGAAHGTAASLDAGLDIDPAGTALGPGAVGAALASGAVSGATLDLRVLEVLRTLFAFGFFDRPAYADDPGQDDRGGDAGVAESTAEQGAVLLSNSGLLPIDPARVHTIAVIGPAATQYIHGDGSSEVTPYAVTTALGGIAARAGQAGVHVAYDDGSDVRRAAGLAAASDMAIVVAADGETEGADKLCLTLTPQCSTATSTPPDPTDSQQAFGDQDDLIAAVAAANPRTAVVLETGAPVLTPWRGSVGALLEAWYPGQEGGTAIARLLFGDADPGGRLPATFPASAGDIPTAAGGAAAYPGTRDPATGIFDETYSEGVMVGYRGYDDHGIAPAFPFGFGLSYTTFAFSDLRVTPGGARVTVRNTGGRAGWAVPELYVGLPSSPGLPEPPRQLAGFSKLLLAPGQAAPVTLPLSARSFSAWSDGAWRVAPGCDTVWVGASSRDLPVSGVVRPGGERRALIRLPATIRRLGVRSVTVYLDGRVVRRVRGRHTAVRVALGAAGAPTARVRVVVATGRGHRSLARAYRRC